MKKIYRVIIALLFSTALVKVLNFLKELEIAYFYGTSNELDYFNIILITPNLILSSIAPALGMVLVTYLANEEKVLKISIKEILFYIIIIFTTIFGINLILLLEDLIDFKSLLFSIVISFLFCIQVLLVYYLHCFGEFNKGSISSLIQILFNLVLILISIWYKSYLILVLGLGIGLIIQILYLIKTINKNKLLINKFETNKRNPFLNSFFSVLLGYGLIEITISIQKLFATKIEIEGIISSISYAYKVMNLPISIILFAVLSVVFPKMVDLNSERLNIIWKNLLLGIVSLILPAAVLFYLNSQIIIELLFGRGEFNQSSVNITSNQLKSFSLLLLPLAIYSSILRIHFLNKKWVKIYGSALSILCSLTIINIFSIYTTNYFLFSNSMFIAFLIGLLFSFKEIYVASRNKDILVILIFNVAYIIGFINLTDVPNLSNLIIGTLSYCLIYVIILKTTKNPFIEKIKVKKGEFNK
ncbi:lipid II flippase MurJ [Ureibacillus sp. NPDC094379]